MDNTRADKQLTLYTSRRVGILLTFGLMAGCVSVPTAQLTSFSDSLTAVQQANKPILADLALAERRLAGSRVDQCSDLVQLQVPGGGTIRDGFCLKDAEATADIVDPPAATSFRAGMDVLQAYTGTLNTLASGASDGDVSAQLNSAAGNLFGIATTVGAAGAGPLAPAVLAAINDLGPIIKEAAALRSRAEARRLILSRAQQVHVLIAAEREATPAIWNIVTSDWRAELRTINPNDTEGAASLRTKVETYRVIMANYVVMLDRLDAAWTKTVDATTNPQPATLADLTALTVKLKADSDTLAKAYAELNAPPGK